MASRPIPIKHPSPHHTSSRAVPGRVSQSLPAVPPSPYFGSLKAPPSLVEAMPTLELPQSVSEPSVLARQQPQYVARSLPGAHAVHSFRIPSKVPMRPGTLVEEDEENAAASLGQSMVSALSSLRIRNTVVEAELGNPPPPQSEYAFPLPPSAHSKPATAKPAPAPRPAEDEDDEDEFYAAHDHADDELQFELS